MTYNVHFANGHNSLLYPVSNSVEQSIVEHNSCLFRPDHLGFDTTATGDYVNHKSIHATSPVQKHHITPRPKPLDHSLMIDRQTELHALNMEVISRSGGYKRDDPLCAKLSNYQLHPINLLIKSS